MMKENNLKYLDEDDIESNFDFYKQELLLNDYGNIYRIHTGVIFTYHILTKKLPFKNINSFKYISHLGCGNIRQKDHMNFIKSCC